MASAGQGKAMEVFPDLHHKMSKKIAQLTKVIYHLNTKNEDHAVEMEVLSASHQVEIQNILRDAANRIAKFKEMVENRQQSLNQEAKVEKLVKKHEQEKAAALQDLANLKSKLQEREQRISADYQGKFEGLKREIESMNKKFQEKLVQLESANQDLVKALADSSRSGSAGIEELRRKHEAEMAEMVRNANEKYQSMLIEQLGIQETLKRDLEARAASEVRLATERLTTEFEKELGQTRAKLSAEKQEALLQLRRELEQRQAELRADFTQRLDRALQDLKSKGDALELLKAQSESRIKELEEKLIALQRSLNDEVGGSQLRTSQLADDLARANDLARNLQAKLTQREEENAALQALLSEKSQVLAQLETSLSRAEQDAALLREALEHAKQSQAHSEDDLLQKLTTSQRETASLREEVNTIAMQLHSAREDAKRLDKERSRAAEEYEQRIARLQSEVDSLRTTVKEAQAQLTAGSQSASLELDALRRRLADAEDRGVAEAQRLAAEHSSAMEELRSRHQTAVDELKSLHASQAQQMGGRVDALTKELDQLRQDYAQKTSLLVAEHGRRTDELTKQHEQELAALKNSFLELEQQLAAVGEQAEQDKAALRNEVSKFENKYKATLKELEAKKKESERAEGLTNGLKTQIESLREELKASQKAFMQKMDLNAAKLEQDWANRLEQELQRAMAEKIQALEAQAQQWASERAQLELAHDEEVKALKLLLQKEAGDAALALAKTERLRESLESQLQQERAARASQVADVTEQLQSQLRTTEENHRLELERLRREFKSTLESREASLTDAHTAEMLNQRQRTDNELADMARSHAESLQLQRQTSEDGLRAALLALEQQMTQEQTTALEAQSNSFVADKERLRSQHKAELDQLSNSLDSKVRALEACEQELRGALGTINSERVERQRREEAFALERDQLLRTHTKDLQKEREGAERRILEVMERADADIKLLQKEHLDVRGKYEERYRDLSREYKLLEERWKNRESRVEDLQRIEMLEKEVADKDEEVQRAKEELVVCKREMLNREENYNQKFGRSVNVGVMQVIKPKEEPPAGPPKAKPTQMRVINAQTGAGMMPGSGLGLGVGVSPSFPAAPSGPGGSSKGSARSK